MAVTLGIATVIVAGTLFLIRGPPALLEAMLTLVLLTLRPLLQNTASMRTGTRWGGLMPIRVTIDALLIERGLPVGEFADRVGSPPET